MLAPQEECFSNIVQDFLICTTIHKARQLGIFQGDIYVRITLDNMIRNTKSYSNSENPYFNEYFVYEIKCTLMELFRLTILYEVKKHTTCKKNPTLGELLIDMQSVWNQSNRCYFKKWGRLEAPIGENVTVEGEGKGFLQIDLAIVTQASNRQLLLQPHEEDLMTLNKWQINQDYEDIEKNLLQNIDSGVSCNIRYTVTIFRGIMSKKSDYLIQFRFPPFKGKTKVAKNTQQPYWNQEISFNWTYPSLAQTFLIQLLAYEHLQWKCISEYEVHFNEIAFKDKPALGPTYVHLYDNLNGSHYVGRLLIEIKSECLEIHSKHVMNMKLVPHLDEKRYWQEESFFIELLVMQGDYLHSTGSNCKINVKLAEHNSNNLDCSLKTYSLSLKKSQIPGNILKYFRQEPPFKAITLRAQLPDNRSKFECDICLQELLDFIKYEIETFKLFQVRYNCHPYSQLKVLRAIILEIINRILEAIKNRRFEHTSRKDATTWDINRLIYLKEYFSKMPDTLRTLHAKLKPTNDFYINRIIDEVLLELRKFCKELQHLLSTTLVQDEWPDLILVSLAGNKEFGFCRLNAKSFLYPSKDREVSPNSQCWKVRNFIFKDIKCQHTCINCGCTVAIIRGCLSIVAETESLDFSANIIQTWQHPEPFYWSPSIHHTAFKCNIYIHQAKIRPGADRDGLCDPYIRIIFCQRSASTNVLNSTLSPIWNSVISFENIILSGEFKWYEENPPLIVLELYDNDKKTADDYLGSGFLPISVIASNWVDSNVRDNTDCTQQSAEDKFSKNKDAIQKYKSLKYLSPPALKWVPISFGGSIRAEILMSGELVEVQEEDSNEFSMEASVIVGIPNAIRPNMKNFVLEVVFAGFRNYNKTTLFSGKHRVKIMMADLILTSGLSTSRLRNSMNFLILYASGVVSLPEQLEYWPAIIATDVAVSSKGQEATLGAVLIPNSKRYLQKHKEYLCVSTSLDDHERDTSTASTSLQMEEEENSETRPLIQKKPQSTYWKRFTSKFQKSSKETKPIRESFNLEEIFNENEFNWWTKFYNSGRCAALTAFKHKLCVYQNELEKQPEFSYLNDWAESLQMVHGVKYKKNSLPKEEIYATLKVNIKLTPCQCGHSEVGASNNSMLKPIATALNPRYQAHLQSLADLVKIVVRVYIVQGLQFRPSQKNAQADSYVKIQLGQKHISDRVHYMPNESNPVFGKCFQLEGLLPREHMLEVSIFNRSSVHDESIGSTFIDLEDRWRTKHRATVGLANEYSSSGYNKWRDYVLPSEILKELCSNNDIRSPRINGNVIEVDGVTFEDETEIAIAEDLQERLSLTVLKHLEDLPSIGYKLVPEHVETRSLYRNECPGIVQGKIQMWIELYDGNVNTPPPIDLTPQPPQIFELRVIVYNVSEVILDEKNIFGTAMTDIYVKGWCTNFDEAQNTDIHYRSMDGEGKFNWRMLFPLKYSNIEDMVVIKRKTGLMEEYEIKQPPILSLQIWDNDLISADDFLGTLEINLSSFPQPYETAKKCSLTDEIKSKNMYAPITSHTAPTKTQRKFVNIFRQKKVRGWFPIKGNLRANHDGTKKLGLVGKIELELEVVTEAEAASYPVGIGRNPPNALPAPSRPETSFNPFTNPWKSIKKIILPKLKRGLITLFILLIIGFSIFLLIMKLPLIITDLGY